MTSARKIKLAVRTFVEFALQSGDLRFVFTGPNRAWQGTMAHQRIQKARPSNYSAEIVISEKMDFQEYEMELSGRIDGIYNEDPVRLDEIKSTTIDLQYYDYQSVPVHWAQAEVYGYFYAKQNSLSSVIIQLTYTHLDTKEIKEIQHHYTYEELKNRFEQLLRIWHEWLVYLYQYKQQRDETIQKLEFPFKKYRLGQRNAAVAVYQAIQKSKKLFLQAPTGIGKTLSVLFPSLKALQKELIEKIFYITAKTQNQEIVNTTFLMLQERGLFCKILFLTSKEQLCMQEEIICDPELCPYAKGFFDKLKGALHDILTNSVIDKKTILEYSIKHMLCPHEFSLEIAQWVDLVVGDYNYVFDPKVYLKRFFEENNNQYSLLVDEAHNLPDRARTMFSAELVLHSFKELLLSIEEKKTIYVRSIRKVNKLWNGYTRDYKKTKPTTLDEIPIEIIQALRDFLKHAEVRLVNLPNNTEKKLLLELYFQTNFFIRTYEAKTSAYQILLRDQDKKEQFYLFCIDPRELLREAMNRVSSVVFFSATLIPIIYYKELLAFEEGDKLVELSTPFPKENLAIIKAPFINTRYQVRDLTKDTIAELIQDTILQKKGNYLVYLPSYTYLSKIKEVLVIPEVYDLIIQKSDMNQQEKQEFLDHFRRESKERGVLALSVLGGVFSEGIDLVGEDLIGVIIIGVGLPQISFEQDLIRTYYREKFNRGYEFAYIYPGMNKVIQAAGRVIRTASDTGIIILADDRYTAEVYSDLFPENWEHAVTAIQSDRLLTQLKKFWQRVNKY